MTRKYPASVSQLVRLVRSTLGELGHEPSAATVESLSFLVFAAMTGHAREYHGVGHVFAVASGLPPLGRLAAIYHDTVYHQVDRGFLPAIWERIGDTSQGFDDDGDKHVILASALREDAADVAAIFGLAPGQTVGIRDGLNEFLSAVLAVRELTPIIGRRHAWTVAACIEATIPFRGKDPSGATALDRLYERLTRLFESRQEKPAAKEITAIVQLAARVANSDVQSFAHADIGEFLDDT